MKITELHRAQPEFLVTNKLPRRVLATQTCRLSDMTPQTANGKTS